MRSPFAAVLAVFVFIALNSSSVLQAGSPEQPAEEFNLEQYAGNVVLVDFWASWCGPCRESFPWMEEMARSHANEGLVIVAVNLDEDRAAAEAFLKVNKLAGIEKRFDPNGELAERYGVSSMPFSLLFNREGQPVYRHAGFHADQTAEYEEHIKALLNDTTGDAAISVQAAAGRKVGVRPWERGELAAPEMQLICDPLESEFDDHIYFSREASSGGRGFGGGGCGCN
jgi:cytochrome c biogenesis protein CcmG/thiol:disulfide interchange protein DsbE